MGGTTFRRTHVADRRRPITVEVGDAKQARFHPQLKTLHWGNECNFSIRLVDEEPHLEARVTEHRDGEITWEKGARRACWYPLDPGEHEHPHLLEFGGHEFEVHLLERPASNTIRFTVRAKRLRFHRQDELTEAEREAGHERPDTVVGSYAVYHESKRHNFDDVHYRTGKAFHLLRPWAEDANGDRVWCDLQVPEDGCGEATVTVPQEFLDQAAYPVLVDPTFGYTTIGLSTIGETTDSNLFCLLGGAYSAAAGDQITDFQKYTAKVSNNTDVQFAAYTISGTTVGSRLATPVQASITSTTKAWVAVTGLAQTLAAATYNVAYGQSAGQTNQFTTNYDSLGGNQTKSDFTHATLPATWANDGTNTVLTSAFATYTLAPPSGSHITVARQAAQRAAARMRRLDWLAWLWRPQPRAV